MSKIYRTEYPRPQFERDDWVCLNGEWNFDYVPGGMTTYPNWQSCEGIEFPKKINVPFCPESKLSGIGYTGFLSEARYRRYLTLSAKQLEKRVILHFGACDSHCKVFVNKTLAGTHRGGYSSFEFDITELCSEGENELIVLSCDDPQNYHIPSGKQSDAVESYDCLYTRTTGIWQTVWLEFIPATHIKRVKYHTDPYNATITVDALLKGRANLTAQVMYDGRLVGEKTVYGDGSSVTFSMELSETHLWEPGEGELYDIYFTYGEDKVKSYFGLRSVALDGYDFTFNGKRLLQRLVLDQGYYPDGIYTAQSEEELTRDVDLGLACGFNGARLHQKAFEERFLYYCDKMGYLVWSEFPNRGLETQTEDCTGLTLCERVEIMNRDYNHPSIICWCPYNEAGEKMMPEILRAVYDTTKAIDQSRPIVDASGFPHEKTDIYDVHDYEQDPAVFAANYDKFGRGEELYDMRGRFQHYTPGLPVMMSEYGGTKVAKKPTEGEDAEGWGYGNDAKDEEEFYDRVSKLTDIIIKNPRLIGYCYTQLYDVEQEVNGLFTYERKPKFDIARLKEIFSREG